jgi:hypothetical protein
LQNNDNQTLAVVLHTHCTTTIFTQTGFWLPYHVYAEEKKRREKRGKRGDKRKEFLVIKTGEVVLPKSDLEAHISELVQA